MPGTMGKQEKSAGLFVAAGAGRSFRKGLRVFNMGECAGNV